MDPNPKSVTAIDSLVTVLASSFGQLKLNGPTGSGPINSLPHEMMLLIMGKLGLDGEVVKLLRLRLVSTRWRSIVEHYCKKKKSLVVDRECSVKFGLKNVPLILKSVDFFGKMLKLFPNVEQLTISASGLRCNIVDAQFRDIASSINSLCSLKQLELGGSELVRSLPFLSQTMNKLEYIKVDFLPMKSEELSQFISQLGPNCVRVHLQGPIMRCDRVLEWHEINPTWFSNLTHLDIYLLAGHLNPLVMHSLCEHATLLKRLNLSFIEFMCKPLVMLPSLLQDLSKLSHLTELMLNNILLPISELELAATEHGLTSLDSVLICELSLYLVRPCTADQFTQLFSVIFPNVVEFTFLVDHEDLDGDAFKHAFEQHLDRFPNLHKHTIYTQRSSPWFRFDLS